MPSATMDFRRQPGMGAGGPPQNMYYTLQPARAPPMYPDSYGTLPSHSGSSMSDYPSSQSMGSSLPQTHYGTLGSQQGQLPSYNNNRPQSGGGNMVHMGGDHYNTLPAQGGNYGTLPSHHDGGRMPPGGQHQRQQQMMGNRELPAPSLTRHSMKILQVPFLVVGEDDLDTMGMRGSPSPSPSPSSTISDPAAPAAVPLQHRPQSVPVQIGSMQRPGGQVHMGQPNMGGTPPTAISGPGSYSQTLPSAAHQTAQHARFPPAAAAHQPQQVNYQTLPAQSKPFPQVELVPVTQAGFPHSVPHGYVHAATLPPQRSSSAIPGHLQQQQRPSPSSSPGSTSSLPASLPPANHPHPHPHPHHQAHHQVHNQPHHQYQQQSPHIINQLSNRPSPTPSPIPRVPPHHQHHQHHQQQQQQQQQPVSQLTVDIPNNQTRLPSTSSMHTPDIMTDLQNNNKFNTFPGHTANMGMMVEKPNSALATTPMMDMAGPWSGGMRSMQEDMQRMQKQMEEQFRNMQVATPALPTPSTNFPEFPAMVQPPMVQQPSFGGLQPPAYEDLATLATPSPSPMSMSTPSLAEPDFSKMSLGSDMGLGAPIVEDTLDGRGGKKQLKLNLDMHDFAPGEVKVRSDKNRLEVTAHHEEKDPNRITCRVFKQQYHLPENTRMAKLQYDMTPDGELKVEGTVKPRHRVKWAADTLPKTK